MGTRRSPGNYGLKNDYVARAETRFLQKALIPDDGGWLASTVGDNVNGHLDVTGVLPGNNILTLWRMPDRNKNVTAAQVRLSVAAASASTLAEVAVYNYEGQAFTRVPNTKAFLSTASTGLKTVTLATPALLLKDANLFIGVVCRNAAVALEGFQSGTGTRVVRGRTRTEAGALQSRYPLANFAVTTTQDVPFIAYLSRDAAIVL